MKKNYNETIFTTSMYVLKLFVKDEANQEVKFLEQNSIVINKSTTSTKCSPALLNTILH